MPKKSKKFHLIIFGCQMNTSDAERLITVLKKIGYTETNDEKQADLVGVIACSVRQAAVDRIYGKLREWQIIKETRPLITLLSGCVLPTDRKKLADKFDLFIDINHLDNLTKDLKNIAPEKKLAVPNFFDIAPSYISDYRAYVPIMTGCNKFCTYCAVPHTRGRETSRPSAQIIAEVKKLLKNGYQEIILLGQNVNSYGLDRKAEIKFPELLKKIDNLGKNFWLKFLTSHPYDMSDDLIQTMSRTKNLTPYLHLPVQSGSDAILKKMNRHYTVNHYKKLIKKIRESLPDMAISTDIIVGFPTETEAQFKETLKLVKEIKYNTAYFAQYSTRYGTTAAKLYKDDVPKTTKKKRWQELNKLIGQQSLAFNKKLVGQEGLVLVDQNKKIGQNWLNLGKLANYTTIKILTKKPLKIGSFVKVKINKALNWGVEATEVKSRKFQPEADRPLGEKV
ncbi:MAG: tRNA (N6-isopentenyl adenosine(37)-C2)-methylthiotransferase MiaB [Patescibacteria group bacterium]|jgi:tRNA-2-methylthio-N6-dimethylallyladenosine synthase